jgi:DNA polymerase-3 subunit alpha
MEKFTRETYGIMVYQEQIMQIASEMGGFTMGEADTLRRAMGKKDRDLMAKQREKFLAGCAEKGTAAPKAERVWELMEKFAGYGFNKCLSADTWVEMADGSRKPITAIRDGDLVQTKDGPHRACRVRPSGVRQIGRLTLANGSAVRCTPDHPIFTERGWVNTEDLKPGDAVAVLDATTAAFQRVEARRRGEATEAMTTPLAWAMPVSFVLEGPEPTYDFEVPGAHSFIANGIVVHNSHAAAYALVAYQTAYFKANYPVEFMAALLTSEMGDTDKIVKYIEECRAMGLTVSPPDVNVSAVQFSVAGETIRFGLAAIKNVGEAAMESILKTRADDGPARHRESHQGGGVRLARPAARASAGAGGRGAGGRPACAA